jgi:hypothetical protein
MRVVTLFLALILVGMSTVVAQNPSSPDSNQQQAAASGGSTLTGCLQGKSDQYYLVEQNGTRHSLMSTQDLSQYVDHQVTVTGKADTSRNAAAGSDAKGHRAGMFSVDNVSDQGACKK